MTSMDSVSAAKARRRISWDSGSVVVVPPAPPAEGVPAWVVERRGIAEGVPWSSVAKEVS